MIQCMPISISLFNFENESCFPINKFDGLFDVYLEYTVKFMCFTVTMVLDYVLCYRGI